MPRAPDSLRPVRRLLLTAAAMLALPPGWAGAPLTASGDAAGREAPASPAAPVGHVVSLTWALGLPNPDAGDAPARQSAAALRQHP